MYRFQYRPDLHDQHRLRLSWNGLYLQRTYWGHIGHMRRAQPELQLRPDPEHAFSAQLRLRCSGARWLPHHQGIVVYRRAGFELELELEYSVLRRSGRCHGYADESIQAERYAFLLKLGLRPQEFRFPRSREGSAPAHGVQ